MATRNPNSTLSFTFLDYSNEKSTTQFNAVEYNILTFPDYLVSIGEFRTALGNISGGAILKEKMTLFDRRFDPVKPTDPAFQREDKWLITIKDDVTFSIYPTEITYTRNTAPATWTVPNEPLLLADKDEADLSATAWVDFIAKFRDVYRTQDGNFGTVLRIDRVSRNL